ncbi:MULTISPECIES: hypothetical protein [Flavobacterium]|uniref:Uncharacterized protein n=1 Tax=Flavobacterium weaverense TaxID=271156 RepID=A0A3M0A1I9_9FLAO|nr:hypothetical protein [Flavobacterium weaverense]RMA78274.1 hypothetical protein BC961_0654 [Flavobacterium weaverense]
MDWLRRTILIIGLSLVIFAAFTASKSLGDSIEIEKTAPSYSPDSIHSSVFIQPQTTAAFILQYKTQSYTVVKYLESYLALLPEFKIKTLFIRYANQDINRCEMVSLLLFPYHSFW